MSARPDQRKAAAAERLAEALRANLVRRKAQKRERGRQPVESAANCKPAEGEAKTAAGVQEE
jgi:hypothetical protein